MDRNIYALLAVNAFMLGTLFLAIGYFGRVIINLENKIEQLNQQMKNNNYGKINKIERQED